MSSIYCFECQHCLTACCNNPESENYGLEVEPFDGCEDGEKEEESELEDNN